MEKVEYDLTFNEALEVCMNGGAVKGAFFADGVFMKFSEKTITESLVVVDAKEYYAEFIPTLSRGLFKQKYRSLSVMTFKELSK